METGKDIIIYRTQDQQIHVQVESEGETVWLSLNQMAALFDRDKSVVSRHIRNIFKTKELEKDSVVAKNATTAADGKTYQVDYYNLDVILAIGYRVNSKQGILFRQWANQILKDYLVKGYAINKKRLAQKEEEIQILKNGIAILGRVIEEESSSSDNAWLEDFKKGLELLDDYDHERLDQIGLTQKEANYPTLIEYEQLVSQMRTEFDSDVFGREKDQNFQSSVAQIEKGFAENDFYPSLEEKAATLLYLVTKNHSFVDGNKRIAAACFLKFLEANEMLSNKYSEPIISNGTLASLTLFIASSKPEEMETVKRLVISVLNRNRI